MGPTNTWILWLCIAAATATAAAAAEGHHKILKELMAAKYQTTCRILTAYCRYRELLPIHRLTDSLDQLRHSIEASSRTIKNEGDPCLHSLYTRRLINPLQEKLGAYKTKLNHATSTLNAFVFKPKDISEALLPNNKHQLEKAIITNLPKTFTERAQGKTTSYRINQAFASSILMINMEAINIFINTITTKFNKNLYTIEQLKALARMTINNKLQRQHYKLNSIYQKFNLPRKQ